MKVDYYFPPVLHGEAADAAKRAQAIGFDGFFTAETAHDPFIPLAFAAAAAPGLDLGTSIAVAFPRSPMVMAQVAWDLAALSGGRFILGLGTQVRAHITRRFSTQWTSPGPRLRDYINSLRAIWQSFQEGTPLRFESESYSFSLITPFFNPGPIDHPDIPVAIAGVGPYLSRLAGELCDGFHIHPFHTVAYLDEVVRPNVTEGARSVGRDPAAVTMITSVFVVTGRDEAELERSKAAARQQIAFYASTPSYRIVLEVEGWDFGDRLSRMSRRGEWEEMAHLIDDEVLHRVAVVAAPEEIGPSIRARYGDRIGRVGYYLTTGDAFLSDEEWAQVVSSTRGHPTPNLR